MTIKSVSSIQPMTYQANHSASQQRDSSTLLSANSDIEDILIPEQKNKYQDHLDTMVSEQINNIKSNYKTAKNMDLTRLYYEQQQKVIEAYMQANDQNYPVNDNDRSITGSLNELYISLYKLHQTVKNGELLWSHIPEEQPLVAKPAVSYENTVQKYNSIMMPTNSSHIHLSI